MKIRLSGTKWLYLVFRGTDDANTIYRSRRFTFWMSVLITLLNVSGSIYCHNRGNVDSGAVLALMAVASAIEVVILGMRIRRLHAGFLTKSANHR